jgi:predicted phosphate transport protein (TIGR00153 family)
MSDLPRTSTSSSLGKRLRRAVRSFSLVPRERRFYELFERQAVTIASSAQLLDKALSDVAGLAERQKEIKELEHRGDEITHEIIAALHRTFVTPFDREDIYALASGMDDIVDYLEEIADTANLYSITEVPQPAHELVELLVQAAAQLKQAAGKLGSGRDYREHIIEMHRLEDLGDSISRRAIADLFGDHHKALEVIKLKELYGLMEDALDRCEDVANVLEGIAIKNA